MCHEAALTALSGSTAGARQPGGCSSLQSFALHPQQLLAADFTAKPPLLLKVYRLLLLFK